MRLILTDQDLRGQTIDVSKRPEGHARQAYLGKCALRGATIIGDIRGSDILDSQCEGLDLSDAQTNGCQWTGSTFDSETNIPPDTSALQSELLLELLRRAVSRVDVQDDVHALADAFGKGNLVEAYALGRKLLSTEAGLTDLTVLDLSNSLAPYPRILAYITSCWTNTLSSKFDGEHSGSCLVQWGDGASVQVDRDKLPHLDRPNDRYELNRWVEKEAGPVLRSISVTKRHVWTASIRPKLAIYTLAHADEWLESHYALGGP